MGLSRERKTLLEGLSVIFLTRKYKIRNKRLKIKRSSVFWSYDPNPYLTMHDRSIILKITALYYCLHKLPLTLLTV
jgi:hypothetical protein